MKGKEKAERWEFYENMAEVERNTIRDVLQSLLVFSSLGVSVIVTDFTGTILLEEDLEKGDLPHLDEEAFVIPTGPRFLVPQPVDKEGRRIFFKGTYIPSLVVVPKCKTGLLMEYPILDHPYYIWTEVPDWLLERMGVASPMIAEVERPGRDMKA
jgi:hypothetical protein